MRIGDAVIRVDAHDVRCAVTTRDPATAKRDLDTLGLVAGYRDAITLGVLAAVVEPGRVLLLDPVEPCTLSSMPDALIVDAVRSPIGKKNGTLASVRADELAGQVLNGLVERVGIEPAEIEDVQMGCVSQVGEQALNVGRVALLVAGWPETVCAATTDRQCGSSMQTAFSATSAIQAGHLDVVVAAGVESMSRVPMGSNLGPDGFAGFSEKLFERWEIVPQGISAEVLADEWNLSREALDAYSYESHRRAIAAIDEGRFEREIVPIEVSITDSERRSGAGAVGGAGLRPAGAHAADGGGARA